MSDTTVPEELLFRFGRDGALQGVHYTRKVVGTFAGQWMASILPPEPITPEAACTLLGDATGLMVARITELEARVAQLEAEIEAAQSAASVQ